MPLCDRNVKHCTVSADQSRDLRNLPEAFALVHILFQGSILALTLMFFIYNCLELRLCLLCVLLVLGMLSPLLEVELVHWSSHFSPQ